MIYKMAWEGVPVPYVRTTQRQKWVDKRYKRYAAWKDVFRLSANTQSFPSELDPSKDYSINIKVYCAGARRADVDNFAKGSMDALFDQDTRVASIKIDAEEYTGRDRVEVELWVRGNRVTSSSRGAAKPKPIRSGRQAVRRVGGGVRRLDNDLQGDRHPHGSPEGPRLGSLQSRAEKGPEDQIPQ